MADGNPNPAIPSDMVAVYDRPLKQWLLYYISTDAKIKYFKGPQDGQLEDSSNNPPYDVSYVDISIIPNLPSPKVGNAQLGVAEYVDNSGSSQTRIYYLDDSCCVCELGWSLAKGGWFRGALTTQEYEAAPGSVITVAVTDQQLKVYYRGKDKGTRSTLWVAWTTRNEETWSHRPIMSY